MDKLSYALGLGIGTQLAQLGAQDINLTDFSQAVKDMLEGKKSQLPQDEAQKIVNDFFQKQEERMMENRREAGKLCKEAGEKYLAENAKKENVKVTASGLQYEVIKEGEGKKPKATDTVLVHYEDSSQTEQSLIQAYSVASLFHSLSTRLSRVGQKVFSSCLRVASIVSIFLISLLMASRVLVEVFLLTQLSSLMFSLSRFSNSYPQNIHNL